MKRKNILISSILLILLIGLFVFLNKDSKIDTILKSEAYAYLPNSVKEYIKEYYDKTGEVILTEKNKEYDVPYLNPEYIEYLNNGKKASEYGYIPLEFVTDHLYSNNNILSKQGINDEPVAVYPSYYNLRDDGYITNIYNQGNEGLCWSFSCSTSLESYLALKSNNQNKVVFSEKQADYATTISSETLDVGTNPYLYEESSIIGQSLNQGGNMLRYINAGAIGMSPVYCDGDCSSGTNYNSDNHITDNKYWRHDYNQSSKLSPYEVYNLDNSDYSIDEALFFDSITSEDSSEVSTFVNLIKNQITNNGSVYVAIGAYSNLSVEYTPDVNETSLNTNGKNYIYYIPYGWNLSGGLNHAVSIIGWDDNYTHNICLFPSLSYMYNAPKNSDGEYYCSLGSLYTIHGAWIIQNSWGPNNKSFVYLPYTTMKSSYSTFSKVSEVDYDNSYRITATSGSFNKGNNREKINKVKFFSIYYNTSVKIYYNSSTKTIRFVQSGYESSSYGTLLKTITLNYPGLYTADISSSNIIIDENSSYINYAFAGYIFSYDYYASIHTQNVNDNININLNNISSTDVELLEQCNLEDNKCYDVKHTIDFNDNNIMLLKGTSRGLDSNDNITFKIKDSSNNDVSYLFHTFRNFSVSNYINAFISYNSSNVPLDTYTIEAYYNDTKYGQIIWNLSSHSNSLEGLGTKENPYIVKTVNDLNNVRNNLSGVYLLNNDIDLTYDTQDSNGLFYNNGKGWNPIDNFSGSFDGQNHVITGLYVNRVEKENNSYRDVGLFGSISNNSNYIRNIIFKDANITAYYNAGVLTGTLNLDGAIELHDIAVMNGQVIGQGEIGGIIGQVIDSNSYSNMFYNLYNSAKVGVNTTNFAGGLIGTLGSYDYNNYYIIADSINVGTVKGDVAVGGIVGSIAGSSYNHTSSYNNYTFKNLISVGEIINNTNDKAGAVFGRIDSIESSETTNSIGNTTALTILRVYYDGYLYGENNDLTNNTTITGTIPSSLIEYKNVNINTTFDHSGNWTTPVVDGIKRNPMLTAMVDHFDFTEVIGDVYLAINQNKNIYDLITPDTDEAKNIVYNYDSEYLNIDSNGLITPLKKGNTSIHIYSKYDGYEDDINVSIADSVDVYYHSNNGEDDVITQTIPINAPYNLDDNTFTYKGYRFIGWNTEPDGSGIPYEDNESITILYDINLYAQWEQITYKIWLYANNGSELYNYSEVTYPDTGNIGLIATNFEKEHYLLTGWNTRADGNGLSFVGTNTSNNLEYVSFDILPFDENYCLRLYAEWELEKHTITFNSNGGYVSMDIQIIPYNTPAMINISDHNRTGYTFAGWNTQDDGQGTLYQEGDYITITSDITLYAQWNINNYVLIFNSNGGTGEMVNQSLTYNTPTQLNINLFTNDGYTFTEWNTKQDGTGISYTDGQEISISQDTTLYAIWLINQYDITFNANGGTGTMYNQVVLYNTPTNLNSNTYTNNGYVFKEWNTKSDGSGISYTDNQSITLTSDITLYAIWTIDYYNIVFNANGGSGTMPIQIVQYNTPTNINDNLYTKNGHSFKEWNTKSDGTGTSYSNGQSITILSNITLYAIWVEDYDFRINKYIVDDNDYIKNISPNTFLEIYMNNFDLNDNYTMEVNVKNNNNKSIIYTGGKTKIYKNGNLYKTMTNVVTGDSNGDGVINSADLLAIRKHLIGTQSLINEYYIASDINKDNNINSSDLLKVRQHLIGIITIE